MKHFLKSKTIWFNSLLIAMPIIVELINLVDADLLDALGFDNSSKITRILSFVVGAVGIFLRLRTSTSLTAGALRSEEWDMYNISIDKFRNSILLEFADYENLWIIANCPDCCYEYGVNPIEQGQINTIVVTNYPDPTVFNADKKPYPKGKF